MPKYRLIIDIATSRVIFFTSDPAVPLQTDEFSVLAEHDGEIPPDMVVNNSWRFTYKNQQFNNSLATKPAAPTLIDKNRASLLTMANTKFDDLVRGVCEQNPGLALYESELLKEAAACVAHEEGTIHWLTVYKNLNGNASMILAAQEVVDKAVARTHRVLELQRLRCSVLQEIKYATSNDQLFSIRDSILKVG